MQCDYYASRRAELGGSLSALEKAAKALEEAKQARDSKARDLAETQMKQAASQAVKIEPHLAYLWFKAHNSELDNSIRGAWQESLSAGAFPQDIQLTPYSSVITYLPQLSFMLRIPFQLDKPYLSKDDRLFHILDNPVRKEWVFHVPMVAATGWKGALRAALWQLGYKEDHEATIRLLGNPRESEEQQAGRLHFFPTFFDQVALEVINPHDRESGVGARGPILMECVPQEAKGELFLLYVPFGASEQTEAEKHQEVAEDLEVLAQGIKAMLTTYGFGAKTSSGFGTAKDQLAGEGKLYIRADLPNGDAPAGDVLPEQQQSQLPRYLEAPGRLHPDLHQPDGSLKSEEEYRAFIESRGGQYSKKDKQLYDKAKSWWEREGRALAESRSQEPEAEAEPKPPEPPLVTEYTFDALSELCEQATRVAEKLRKEAAG